MLAIGVMIWLGSELMFFSDSSPHCLPFAPTGVVASRRYALDVCSRASYDRLDRLVIHVQRAVWLIENRRRAEAEVGDRHDDHGHAFVSNQAYDGRHLARVDTNSYGSSLHHYGLTVCHVILGIGRNWRSCSFACCSEGDPGELSTFQASVLLDFVDVVWIGLYSPLFLLK